MENPIEELKKLAKEKGVCCANCENSEKALTIELEFICKRHYIFQLESNFCSDFEPKKGD